MKEGKAKVGSPTDACIQQCTGCREKFTMIIRKHHCGKCGNVYCGNCSSKTNNENVSNGIKERVCISCSTRAFLVRRKAKTIKKVSKSIVVKSMKFGKLDQWDSPELKKPPSTAKAQSAAKNSSQMETQPESMIPDKTSSVHDADKEVVEEEDGESDRLITRPPPLPSQFHTQDTEQQRDEEEDERRVNQGMLCILPPTVFSFLFGGGLESQN